MRGTGDASALIDLSSDTVTRPTDEMRRVMYAAPVGDEQRGEDPSVRALEEEVAELTGKEAAVFLPSGTMCNIVAFFLHCAPGDEVILHRDSHPAYSENAGPAVHSRVSLHLLDGDRGIFTAEQVVSAVQPRGHQKARSRLVSVENTNNRGGGSVWSVEEIEEVCTAAAAQGLHTHLDGARLLNAVVASGMPAARYCAGFDSIWIDLSKGLGCPIGAVLAGSVAFAAEARWAKHLFGGAMRQAGIVAAAGVYALRHHVERLADDHALARSLADRLADLPGIEIVRPPETNIVQFDVAGTELSGEEFLARAEEQGVRFSLVRGTVVRAVTHLDVAADRLPETASAVRAALAT